MDGFFNGSSQSVINEICSFRWEDLNQPELLRVAKAYYFFSVQFRENLQLALQLHPDDENLRELEKGECNTNNLSPWPNVAAAGEAMDHDEFMRRALRLSTLEHDVDAGLEVAGQRYLEACRAATPEARAQTIASYENGGLETVFRAMLRCQHWDCPTLQAFRHFLLKHIEFDSDVDAGHGALSRQLRPNDQLVTPLWAAFREILLRAAGSLASEV